jgi:single-stranded-DNA-specific exonuclease
MSLGVESGRVGGEKPQAGAAFLGVERSLCGRRWRQRAADDRLALALAQRLSLPEPVARVLAGRGIGIAEAESFLTPTLRALLPDPHHLRDMALAAGRVADAVMAGEPIAVFGDYDVDGATSAALLKHFLAACGVPVRIYIPDRMKEGYGPNAPALLRLKSEGIRLVITVDCGTAAFEPLASAAEAGLEVIVVDHHIAEPRLPRALAVINPNRFDEESPHRQLAAVGVAFLLAVAVNRALREAGWYRMRCEPDLMQWLDLVALGTVCDVVPLTGVNRALVAQGLKVMSRRSNPGLAALADVARIDTRPSAYHLGFLLGPRVNAGGRVGAADLGARLLTTADPIEAQSLARQLDAYNQERQAIEAAVLEAAIAATEAEARGAIVFAAGEGWHPGVIGIVASRLKERYGRPAFVIALDGGTGKGSGRSVAGIDMGAAIVAARQAGLLVNGGGHAMAAGLTLARDKLGALREFLESRIGAEIAERQIAPSLSLDGTLSLAAANRGLVDMLDRLQPYGVGNSEPVFAVRGAMVVRSDVVGSGHVRCILADGGGGRLKAIAFRSLETPLGQALLGRPALPLHLAGHLRADGWNGGEDVQFVIEDGAAAPPV